MLYPQHGEAREEVSADGLDESRISRGSCSAPPWPPIGTLADVYSWVKAARTPPKAGPTQYTCKGREGLKIRCRCCRYVFLSSSGFQHFHIIFYSFLDAQFSSYSLTVLLFLSHGLVPSLLSLSASLFNSQNLYFSLSTLVYLSKLSGIHCFSPIIPITFPASPSLSQHPNFPTSHFSLRYTFFQHTFLLNIFFLSFQHLCLALFSFLASLCLFAFSIFLSLTRLLFLHPYLSLSSSFQSSVIPVSLPSLPACLFHSFLRSIFKTRTQ